MQRLLLGLALAAVLALASPALASYPALTAGNGSGAAGSGVTISGSGFLPGESISVWFGNSRSSTSSSGSTYADSSGSFSLPMTVPYGGSGPITVMAQGNSSGLVASGSFYIGATSNTSPSGNGSLALSPYDGPPGAPVTVYGSAFPSSTAITIYFGGSVAGTVASDSGGHFTTTVVVPSLPQGLVAVTATGADPYNPPKFVVDAGGSGTVPILNPTPQPPPQVIVISPQPQPPQPIVITPTYGYASLAANPGSGPPGAQVAITGTNFGAYENVNVTFGGSTQTIATGGNGAFSFSMTAPQVAASQNVSITAAGQSSGRVANTSFYDVYYVQPAATDYSSLQAQIDALKAQVAQLTALVNQLVARLSKW